MCMLYVNDDAGEGNCDGRSWSADCDSHGAYVVTD